MNLKKFFSLICLSVCFLFAFAEDIDIESLYRSSALPTGNALLAAAANGTVKTATELQNSTFWNTTMNWSISTSGDKGTPWLLPTSNSKAIPYQRTGQFTFAPSAEISVGSKAEIKALLGAYRPHRVTLTRSIDFDGDTINTLFEIGSFDGQDHTISNFVLQKHPSFGEYGFFYRVDSVLNLTLAIKEFTYPGNTSRVGILVSHLPSGGVIRNCHVKPYTGSSITITGADSVGGLVGFSEGTIDGCSMEGINVNGAKYIGGLVGISSTSANITNCSVDDVEVTASNSFVGGLIGLNRATIDGCSATSVKVTGSTNSDSYVGGLVGQNNDKDVKNSKVTNGTITGNKFLGGLVGHTLSGSLSNDTVSNVTITATDEQVGGLTGYLHSGSFATNCKANRVTISSINSNKSGGLVGYLDGNILSCKVDSSTVSGASNIGGMVGISSTSANITNCAVDSIAVTARSYVGGLIGLNRATIDSCSAARVVVKSTADSDSYVGGLVGQNNDNPVKNSKVTNSKIDGKKFLGGLVGHTLSGSLSNDTVSNVTITATDEQVGGLTGYLHSGSFATNCKANRVTISSNTSNRSGGLVGYLNGNIFSCKVDTSTVSGASKIGGMVGECDKNTATITSCAVDSVAVTATGEFVGGLIGLNRATIDSCSATRVVVKGSTSYDSYVGGLVGQNNDKDVKNSKVTNSTITGNKCLGGLVGHTLSGSLSNDTVSNVTITATNNQAGGLTSYIVDGQTVTNCKANRVTISGVDQIGGLVGLLEGSIASCKVDTAYVNGSGDNVGGLVGESKKDISNSKVDNATVSGLTNTGGLVGFVSVACTLANDTVINSKITGSGIHTGGLLGCDASTGLVTVKDCRTSLDSVSGTLYVAGFVGRLNGSVTGGFADSMVIRSSDATNSCAGGIVGSGERTATAITGVSARHISVTASGPNAGGIAGYTLGSVTSSKVDTSSINGTGSVGGVVGWSKGSISSCSIDSVRVSGTTSAIGGIAGFNDAATLASDTVNNSIITSGTATAYTGSWVGGIAGNNSGTITGGIVRGGSVDLYISNASGSAICNGVGGIAGTNGDGKTISGSMVLGTKVTLHAKEALADKGCGGIAGNNYGGIITTSLSSNVTVKTISDDNAATGIGTGGIVGYSSNGGTIRTSLVKENTITGEYYIGGVVGRVPTDATVAISNCHVHGGVISTSLSSTSDDVSQGGIVGYVRGTVENCLVTNTVIRNYITDAGKLYIGGIVGGSQTTGTTIKNNKAMIDYFDIRAKFIKSGINFGRVYAGGVTTTQGNQGWAETYIKYYHKKFGINWNVDNYYRGPKNYGNNARNGENIFVGDVCTTATTDIAYKSIENTSWSSQDFSIFSWDLDQLGSKKFAVLKTFKDSSYAPLVANRGNEYMEKMKAENYTGVSVAFPVSIKIFSPRAFDFGYNNDFGKNHFLYFSANKVELYTDILLEEDNNSGNSTFWAVDLNTNYAGNIYQPLINLINVTAFEFDGHGYSIDGYDNPYTGTGYDESSLISSIANCNYTVRRLEVAKFHRYFAISDNYDQKIFGTILDKVDSSSTFEDIYIKNPKIDIDDSPTSPFNYLGGLVGQIANGTVNFTRVAAYMSLENTLYTKHSGYLGGIVGYVSGGSVDLNNVATYLTRNFYTEANTSSSQGFYIGYRVPLITTNSSWFGGTLLPDRVTIYSLPTQNTNPNGTFYEGLGSGNAELQGKPNWHIPTTTADIDSIYLVREPYTGNYD